MTSIYCRNWAWWCPRVSGCVNEQNCC